MCGLCLRVVSVIVFGGLQLGSGPGSTVFLKEPYDDDDGLQVFCS